MVIGTSTVRPAREADRGAILALVARFAERQPAWRTREEVVEGTVRVIGDALAQARPDEAFFVATDAKDVVVGFIYLVTHDDFFTNEPYVHISELAVASDGAGIGRALMTAGEAWARGRGARVMTLHVTQQNERAFAIYEKAGYAVEHRKMRKALG